MPKKVSWPIGDQNAENRRDGVNRGETFARLLNWELGELSSVGLPWVRRR